MRPKHWATLSFIGMGGDLSKGHLQRAASQVRGKPGYTNYQVKKGLDEESISAESRAAESSNKMRTKNG